jgi:hypothetical protein
MRTVLASDQEQCLFFRSVTLAPLRLAGLADSAEPRIGAVTIVGVAMAELVISDSQLGTPASPGWAVNLEPRMAPM